MKLLLKERKLFLPAVMVHSHGQLLEDTFPVQWERAGGKMHKGIDIARPSDLTIKAADNGVVVSAGYDGGYGNKIVIDHQNGIRTVYAHLASIGVSVGQTVAKGSGYWSNGFNR